jgi:hypothetical protein
MRGDVKRKTLPCSLLRGRLFDLHPAQRCGLAAYFLSLTPASCGLYLHGFMSDGGSTPSARELRKQGCWLDLTCQP